MALSIKNREVEALARELARVTRKPLTRAVRDALEREVKRETEIAKAIPDIGLAARIMEIGRRSAARPLLNDLTEDEILGYDEIGAPTR